MSNFLQRQIANIALAIELTALGAVVIVMAGFRFGAPAATRGGFRATPEALAAERLAHKPQSPWAQRLWRDAGRSGMAQAAE